MLSPALHYSQDVIFDNVHYDEQLECYRRLLLANPLFMEVVKNDLAELNKRMLVIKKEEKREKVGAFVESLQAIIE